MSASCLLTMPREWKPTKSIQRLVWDGGPKYASALYLPLHTSTFPTPHCGAVLICAPPENFLWLVPPMILLLPLLASSPPSPISLWCVSSLPPSLTFELPCDIYTAQNQKCLPTLKEISALGITIKKSEKPAGAQCNFHPNLVLVDEEVMLHGTHSKPMLPLHIHTLNSVTSERT